MTETSDFAISQFKLCNSKTIIVGNSVFVSTQSSNCSIFVIFSLNEYGDLIPTLPIFDSQIRNASSTHGLLVEYSARRAFVLPWIRTQAEQ